MFFCFFRIEKKRGRTSISITVTKIKEHPSICFTLSFEHNIVCNWFDLGVHTLRTLFTYVRSNMVEDIWFLAIWCDVNHLSRERARERESITYFIYVTLRSYWYRMYVLYMLHTIRGYLLYVMNQPSIKHQMGVKRYVIIALNQRTLFMNFSFSGLVNQDPCNHITTYVSKEITFEGFLQCSLW